MANFITNSAGTTAVKISDVNVVKIVSVSSHTVPETLTYEVLVRMKDATNLGITYENCPTLEDAQSKGAILLAALEA